MNLYEIFLTSNLVKLEGNISGSRSPPVLNKYIGLWLEYCRYFCTAHFINQRSNILIPDEVHVFFDRKYKDCFLLLHKESVQNKNIPENHIFLFQFHFELLVYP